MSDENKTPETEEEVRDEMEELARIFREELGKAREEAEKAEDDENSVGGYEIEGYAVTNGDSAPSKDIPEDELCECCGERPKGTEKDPKSPFCEECAAIMEKYPYDFKGIIAFVLSLAAMFVAIGLFVQVVPIFSGMFRGDKAVKNSKLYSAISYYAAAESALADTNASVNPKGLRNHEALLFAKFGVDPMVESKFGNASLLCALTLIENNYDVNKSIPNKKIEETYNKLISSRATIYMLGMYDEADGSDYGKIMKKLDQLIGKKIYVSNLTNMTADTVHDELDKDFKPTGDEEVFTYDEGWIRFYQYLYSEMEGKTDKMIEYLEKANEVSTDYEAYTGAYLVQKYLDNKEYDKAEQIVNRMGEKNSEDPLYYDLLARIYRYRDKNYKAAMKVCEKGLKAAKNAADVDGLEEYAQTYLYLEEALDLIMLKKYSEAYTAVDKCCAAQNEFYGYALNDARDLYAILALATGDDENFEQMAKDIAQNVEYYGEEYNFAKEVTDYKNNKITIEEIAMSGKFDGRMA